MQFGCTLSLAKALFPFATVQRLAWGWAGGIAPSLRPGCQPPAAPQDNEGLHF